MSVVARFEVTHTRFLDPHGAETQPLPDFTRDPRALVPLYRNMVLTRSYDARAVALQRTGQLGTFASSLGQEAIGTGIAAAMRPEDVLLPSYREAGAQLLRGVRMTELLRFWSGDEAGMDFRSPRGDFPVCVPIATQACHAVGVATAFQVRGQPRVAVCAFGDGATSKGDFYEAINLAGVWRLPVVFVCADNQYAISVPRPRQSAAQTLAQKAIAAGFEGLQVDGNDVIAMRHAAERAIARARAGGGPTLIEALTYRLTDHTTADDAKRYRSEQEVSEHWPLEPLGRLRTWLVARGAWTKEDEEALIVDCSKEVQAAVDEYLAFPPPPPGAMFEHLYAALPAPLASQRDEALRFAAARRQEPGHG
ncbi:MAG TPA: pyruvate dehydrogenase (acetyl-transferring) E1 component subunit alpha [Burkholderiales bacterium]